MKRKIQKSKVRNVKKRGKGNKLTAKLKAKHRRARARVSR